MKKLKQRIMELEDLMLDNPAPEPPTQGTLNGVHRERSNEEVSEEDIKFARDLLSDFSHPLNLARPHSGQGEEVEMQNGRYPRETLYMNRAGGRVQMFYESCENLWDEETF